MRTDFRDADIDALCNIYNKSVSDRYAIDADLFRQHTVESPTFDWGASCIDPGKAFIAIKRSPVGLYSGPSPDTSYISVVGFQDPTVLLDLIKEAKHCLIDRGVAKLAFGSDSGHFFPGCPIDCPNLRDFLLIGGFEEGGESHDLERDLIDYQISVPIPGNAEFRPVETEDLPLLDHFLQKEFPGRWHYDTFKKINDEHESRVVFGLFHDEECKGFALTQRDGCKTQIGGAVWKKNLGLNWCSVGPIGISKEMRGRGFGNALLAKTLEVLRNLGGRQCIIDWTGLLGFYESHGFQVTRSYRSLTLDFERYRPN